MKYISIINVILVLKAVTGTDNSSESNSESEDDQESFYQIEKVPLILYGNLREQFALEHALTDPSKDMVCSPLAALVPLAKLLMGASGQCEEQLQEAVGAYSPKEVKAQFRPLLKHLKSLTGITVAVISRIYTSNKNQLNSLFTKNVKDIFKSSVNMADLGSPVPVAQEINDWVATKSKQAIPTFLNSSEIRAQEGSLMIFNTVYLSAQWKHAFTLTDSTMTRGGRYKHFDSDFFNCQIVEIPFTIDSASFTIFLPKVESNFSTLLEKLKSNPEQIQNSLNRMTKTYLQLSIRKFETSTDLDLIKAFQKLGLTHIFNVTSSGLTNIIQGKQNLYVTNAVQKMVIKVNERGVGSLDEEKVASPSLDMAPLFELENPGQFTVEVPFLYIITVNKEIIVTGVHNPK